jgi:5-(carboxyamino)imidazole ribonucleotide mutase
MSPARATKTRGKAAGKKPLVGIIMGSDSDLPVMQGAAEVLGEFGVPVEMHVVSAHRTPGAMMEYAQTAAKRGLRVIIAGAGGAAHLPGMTASATTLPVIGVPVPLQHLSGLDSLLSIVQMPAGIPVATMSIGGARNAGILAARILALSDAGLAKKLDAYAKRLAEETRSKDAGLRRRGTETLSTRRDRSGAARRVR